MSAVAELVYENAFKDGLRPTEALSVSEWADKYRYLPKEGGAKEPGPWRTSRVPYTREIMDALGPFCSVEQIKVIKGTQVALTECGINWFGHTVHIDPSSMMMVLPTLEVAKRHSKTKIKHTIDKSPVLKARIPEAREKDSGNTTLTKEFPGGILIICGANSSASFRNVSIKKLMLDEIDSYEADLEDEGDPCSLAEKRTDSFGPDKKIYKLSTPTIKGLSKIEKEFADSDQRHYYIPCPSCGHLQYLRWEQMRFEHQDHHLQGEVHYACEACNYQILEYHKTAMLEAGKWIPHNAGHRYRGYKLPSFYSPVGFLSWRDIVEEFLKAKREKDVSLLKAWVNTRLAEVWDDDDQPLIEESLLLARREEYGPIVPMQALCLVAGTDVQRDRIEVTVVGFGTGEEWINMEHKIIYGSLADKHTRQDLDDYLFAPWLHASGATMHIACTLIDSGDGVNSQEIYDYVRPRQRKRIFASKGSQLPRRPIFERARKQNQGGIRHFNIGTDTAKDSIYSRLDIKLSRQQETELFTPLTPDPVEINPMAMRWNTSFDEEYFKQLVSEVPEKKKKSGRWKRAYKQIRERNEAIDCAVLCLAAIRIIKPNWRTLVEKLARAKAVSFTESQFIPVVANDITPPQALPAKPIALKPRPLASRRTGGWIRNW